MPSTPNAVRLDGDVAYLAVNGQREVAVDAADLPRLAPYRWYVVTLNGLPTVCGTVDDHIRQLAQWLRETPRAKVRYANGDRLDCRRANLLSPTDDVRIEGDIAYLHVRGAGGREADALLDATDVPLVLGAGVRWTLLPNGYVAAWKRQDGRTTVTYLHRLITDARPGEVVDHGPGGQLDYRRVNLEAVTSEENARRRAQRRGGKHPLPESEGPGGRVLWGQAAVANDVAAVPTTGGLLTRVDAADLSWLREKTAHAVWVGHRYYVRLGNTYLHRMLAGAQSGEKVDHVNNDGLDNRRANLRRCTNQQNMQNRSGPNHNSRTGVRGVSLNGQSYLARVWFGQRSVAKTFPLTEEGLAAAGIWAEQQRATHMTHSAQRIE